MWLCAKGEEHGGSQAAAARYARGPRRQPETRRQAWCRQSHPGKCALWPDSYIHQSMTAVQWALCYRYTTADHDLDLCACSQANE